MRRFPLVLLLLGLSACEPFDRPATWSLPHGSDLTANNANLRTMVADPYDLIVGANSPNSRGSAAEPAVRRLLDGRRPPLPALNASNLQGAPNTAPAAPGPASLNTP
jgi:hypothetical protein